MATCPPAFKAVKMYLARAEELDAIQADDPTVMLLILISKCNILAFTILLFAQVVAYYCRQFAMMKALEIRQSNPDITGDQEFLLNLMTKLEADKPKLPSGTTKETAQVTVAEFAHSTFMKADEEDRSGVANKVWILDAPIALYCHASCLVLSVNIVLCFTFLSLFTFTIEYGKIVLCGKHNF